MGDSVGLFVADGASFSTGGFAPRLILLFINTEKSKQKAMKAKR